MNRLPAVALMALALVGSSASAQAVAHANSRGFAALDHVVAVINGDVLLQSDVVEEMHYAALEPFRAGTGNDTRLDALRRLIDRSLIVRQMKEQRQFKQDVSNADVQKSLLDLRAHLPQCAKYDCKTEAGWKAFLAANDLTEPEVEQYWKQRLVILRFIDMRFRTGIRIPGEDIASYYQKSVVPVFVKQHENAPPLKEVSARIQQILLEQQVNGMLQDWLKSLREEGSVRIVDTAYASVAENSSDEEQTQ